MLCYDALWCIVHISAARIFGDTDKRIYKKHRKSITIKTNYNRKWKNKVQSFLSSHPTLTSSNTMAPCPLPDFDASAAPPVPGPAGPRLECLQQFQRFTPSFLGSDNIRPYKFRENHGNISYVDVSQCFTKMFCICIYLILFVAILVPSMMSPSHALYLLLSLYSPCELLTEVWKNMAQSSHLLAHWNFCSILPYHLATGFAHRDGRGMEGPKGKTAGN